MARKVKTKNTAASTTSQTGPTPEAESAPDSTNAKTSRAPARKARSSATKTTSKSATAVAEPTISQGAVPEPTHEQIQARAYELYQARKGQGGDARADWLAAEQDLRRRMNES